MERRHITISKFTSPQWDHKPDQVQLGLTLLVVLVNAHLFLDLAHDPALADPGRVAVYRAELEADLWLAICDELPPAEETEDDDNPFAEFINGLDIPEEHKRK